MANIEDKEHIKEQSRELERLVIRADHLANFGTLTSLVSTLAYFVESTFVKPLSKWISYPTIGAVLVGIGSVLASYYYKLKAGRIALYSPAHIGADGDSSSEIKPTQETVLSREKAEKTVQKNWVAGVEARPAQIG